MLAALLLPAALAAAAPPPPDVTRLEARLSAAAAGRRLLLAAGDAPRREARKSGLPLAVDERGGPKPEIVLDLDRLGELPPGEPEAEYALALCRASIAAPLPLVDVEQACLLRTAEILVQLAPADIALSQALKAVEEKPAPAAPALGRAGAFLAQFELGPERAYWLVESGALPREAVRLTDVEDLFTLHAADLRALKSPPDDPYGVLAGRRYPARLVRAAYQLRAPGELERLREALGSFDVVGAESLRLSLLAWRRSSPK